MCFSPEPPQVHLVPGIEEQRGTRLEAALSGAAPFLRPVRVPLPGTWPWQRGAPSSEQLPVLHPAQHLSAPPGQLGTSAACAAEEVEGSGRTVGGAEGGDGTCPQQQDAASEHSQHAGILLLISARLDPQVCVCMP